MYSKFHLLFCLLLAALLPACKTDRQGTSVISGTFTNGSGVGLHLEEASPLSVHTVDSVIMGADGSFCFTLSPGEPGFYALKTADGRMMVLTLAPGDTLNLTGDLVRFPQQVTLRGPEDALLLHDFFSRASARKSKADSLQRLLVEKQDDSLFVWLTLSFDTIFNAIWAEQRADGISFLREHPGSLAALIVTDYTFGSRTVLSMEEDLPSFKSVDSALTARYPGNRHVIFYHKKIADFERQRKLREGTNP